MDTSNEVFINNSGGLKNDLNTRMGFIRKVYGILAAQMTLTTVFVFAVYSVSRSDPSKLFFMFNWGVAIGVFVLYIGTFCALMCCGFHR